MPNNEAKDISWGGVGHLGLDVVGLGADLTGVGAPVGAGADALNAIWYAKQGDYLNAAFSTISVIPGIGDLIGKGGKFASWASKLPRTAAWFTKYGPKVAAFKKKLKGAQVAIQEGFNIAAKNEKLAPHVPKMQSALNTFISEPDTPQQTLPAQQAAPVTPAVGAPGTEPAGNTPSPHPTVASRKNWLYKAIACEYNKVSL